MDEYFSFCHNNIIYSKRGTKIKYYERYTLISKWQTLSLYILTLGHKHYKCVLSLKHYFSPNIFTIIFLYLLLLAKSISSCICIPGCPTCDILGEGNIWEWCTCFFSVFHIGNLFLESTTKTTKRYFLLVSPCSCTLLIFKLPNFQVLM